MARTLARRSEGILNYSRRCIATANLEGIYAKIKAMIRRAYGIRPEPGQFHAPDSGDQGAQPHQAPVARLGGRATVSAQAMTGQSSADERSPGTFPAKRAFLGNSLTEPIRNSRVQRA
ncbi:MAG: transposase [Deltaproteobacteria bacterium]|nr:transposase [Deltaproteobacteria bacterium]